MRKTHSIHARPASSRAAAQGRVLIVEPDELMRWSMEAYLRRWFEVRGVRDAGEADRLLETGPFDAMIVSDGLARRQADPLRQHARSVNPRVRIICTVSDVSDAREPGESDCIEKPFKLSSLARLLGVSGDESKST